MEQKIRAKQTLGGLLILIMLYKLTNKCRFEGTGWFDLLVLYCMLGLLDCRSFVPTSLLSNKSLGNGKSNRSCETLINNATSRVYILDDFSFSVFIFFNRWLLGDILLWAAFT